MRLMRLTKVNSAGGEFDVWVSKLHVEYVEQGPGELTVVRTGSACLYVKQSAHEILQALEGGVVYAAE